MLPQPPMLPQPNPLRDPGNLGHNIFRRCTIHEPLRIEINSDFLYEKVIPGWKSPYNVIKDMIFLGGAVTIDIDIFLDEVMTCCKEYHLPIEPFITYEESDIDWLLYCGLAKEYKQSILNADTIYVTFYKNGQLYSVKTKLLLPSPKQNFKNNIVTLSLTVIPN